jgi:hypothetical protein
MGISTSKITIHNVLLDIRVSFFFFRARLVSALFLFAIFWVQFFRDSMYKGVYKKKWK